MAREVTDVAVVNRIKLGQAEFLDQIKRTIPLAERSPTLILDESGAVRTNKGVQIRPAPPSPTK